MTATYPKYETLLVERRGSLALVTLNRPKAKNALDIPMREELADLALKLRGDRELSAVVLKGAGDAFCSGGDLKALKEDALDAERAQLRIGDVHTWLPNWIGLDLPVVAAVDGPAYGAGLNLALTADFVLASDRARFCSVFGRIGFVPDLGGFFLLPRIVGLQNAKDLMFTCRAIDSEEAKAMGIVHSIHKPEALEADALAFAGRFTHASRTAIGLTKRILLQAFHSDQQMLGELEASAQAVAASSEYHGEMVRRFLAKEPLPFDWDRMDREDS